MGLKISSGIDGIPANTIPDDPTQFVAWFKSTGIKRWLANADVRNAIPGAGISISGSISSPATISADATVQALFAQPYVLVGGPIAPAMLTGYRSIAAQNGVISLADGGAETSLTVGIVNNGISNTQIRQGVATSVIGNSTSATANVADIAATTNNTVLVCAAGTLSFSALPLAAIAATANNTVLGNVSGAAATPIALSTAQLTALINAATTSLTGAIPALSGSSTQYFNGAGAWTTPAYPTGANPSGTAGLSAVNGSSANFMRADGAPALSQAIAPTWTGAHIFAPSTSVVPITVTIGSHALSAATFAASSYAWGASQQVGIDIGAAGAVRADTSTTAALNSNLYFNGANWIYKTSAAGGEYNIASGVHTWTTAPAGTAGGTATVVTRMSLSNAGALSVASGLGINGNAAAAQSTGWGTPTGASVENNFAGASASLTTCSAAIAELITVLKAVGILGT